jgi:hypothetical protein
METLYPDGYLKGIMICRISSALVFIFRADKVADKYVLSLPVRKDAFSREINCTLPSDCGLEILKLVSHKALTGVESEIEL